MARACKDKDKAAKIVDAGDAAGGSPTFFGCLTIDGDGWQAARRPVK